MISYLILGIGWGFAAAVQPGPLQSYLISRSLSQGWQRVLPAAFAPLISDGPIIALVLVVVNRIPSWLITSLQFAGGIFLLFLAINTWKTWKNYGLNRITTEHSGRRSLLQAIFINFLNPAPYLGWSLITGPLLIKGWREDPVFGMIFLMGFYIFLIIISAGIIILFSSTRKFGISATRWLIGISAIVLGCFGIYQLWSGARGLQSLLQ